MVRGHTVLNDPNLNYSTNVCVQQRQASVSRAWLTNCSSPLHPSLNRSIWRRPTVHASENPTVRASYRPLVLVVDDDRDARAIYREYLRAMGCRVITARDGGAAIDQAVLRRPDVIVMDLAMPYMDGLTATRHLRRQAPTRRVPIIALTAVPTSRDSARQAGCDAFLAKPCLPELLWWEVRVLLSHMPSRRATSAHEPAGEPPRPARPHRTARSEPD